MYSIYNAAHSQDDRIDPNQDIAAYDRENYSVYPYKSHGQYIRAFYGLTGCALFVAFNGWRSFVPPFTPPDFLASYINVSSLSFGVVVVGCRSCVYIARQ
jgi:amino acid transporter